MAFPQAIGAAMQAIQRYLDDSCPRASFPNALVELVQSGSFKKLPMGLSIYPYRVAVSTARRNLPPRRTPDGKKLRPALPVDVSILITPWAEQVEVQERLLGWTMRALADLPIIPATELNRFQPEGEVFRSDESIEIQQETLTLGEYFQLWDSLKIAPQPSATYAVRMIAIESRLTVPEAELVDTRTFDYVKEFA